MMDNKFSKAESRVSETAELAEHADFILADWAEGDEHFEWVATAPVEEIVDWVEAGAK